MSEGASGRTTGGSSETPRGPGGDTERAAEALDRLAGAWPRVLAQWSERQIQRDYFALPDPRVVSRAFFTLGVAMLRRPDRLAATQARLWSDWMAVWEQAATPRSGQPAEPVTARDRRFQGAAWSEHPAFDVLRRLYGVTAEEMQAAVQEAATDLDAHEAKLVNFYARRLVDALSPSNVAGLNPEVLEAIARSGGENLLRGAANLMEDMARGQGMLRIRQTDLDAFELGRDIAATPGKVVYQNDLMQLIQYAPTTETVARRPLLIVPPWINKFYILDLTPKKSFIRWAVDQGLTVFVISWVNPDARYADVAFDDYLFRGPLAALDAIEQATGEREVNATGYCIGGTLLACTLAYMAAKDDQRVQSATYFTSLLDFTDVGELGVFIDEEQIAYMEREMAGRGYLEGSHLGNAFNLLQANDLIWSFAINNYLLGKDPAPFDLLYWNSDSTRMPYRMQSFYLRNMYLDNRLREPGGIRLGGVPIDLSAIELPSFFLATERDHIAPWRACYHSALLPGGDKRFVLAGSGHIAGVMNPAGSRKYGYRSNADLPADPDTWLAAAEPHEGSWWPEWRDWIMAYAGDPVSPRQPGDADLPALEDAPGSYVRVRIDPVD